MSKQCWLCGCDFSETSNSKEHIIPRAIGGRRTVSSFICKTCNNKTGGKRKTTIGWDAVLTDRLHGAGLLFDISRQGKPVPRKNVYNARGEALVLQPGSTLSDRAAWYEVKNPDGSISVHVTAPNSKQLKKLVEELKSGYRKKYPNRRLEQGEMIEGKRLSKTPIGFEWDFDAPEFRRSVVKSVLALACSMGVGVDDCRKAVDYLRDDKADYDDDLYLLCYSHDLVRNRPRGLPIHCAHVVCDPSSRTILAYVELYGVVRVIICISKAYDREGKEATYAINPITGKMVAGLAFDLDHSKFLEIVETQTPDVIGEGMKKSLDEVLSYGEKLRFDRERKEHTNESIGECLSELGLSEGDEMSDEQALLFSNCVAAKVTAFIEHWMKPLDFPEGFDPSQPVRPKQR